MPPVHGDSYQIHPSKISNITVTILLFSSRSTLPKTKTKQQQTKNNNTKSAWKKNGFSFTWEGMTSFNHVMAHYRVTFSHKKKMEKIYFWMATAPGANMINKFLIIVLPVGVKTYRSRLWHFGYKSWAHSCTDSKASQFVCLKCFSSTK